MQKRIVLLFGGAVLSVWLGNRALASDDVHEAVIPNLPAAPTFSASTVPANGDVNPYGVAFVPRGFAEGGPLNPGDVLVSNFNNSSNLQGTGSTIVRITPDGQQSLFFQAGSDLGLTTALGVLKRGFVLVGSLPTTDGTSATVQQGSLLVLDRNANVVANLSDASLLDGPWDLTIRDRGEIAQVFVSNVLSGTVTRLDLKVPRSGTGITVRTMTQIASGYLHRTDPAALVVGPTGLAFDEDHDVLYVASTGDNEIFSVSDARKRSSDAGTGTVVVDDASHLHGPLALALAPNGDLITANGDAVNADPNQPSEIAEFTPSGEFVDQFSIDSAPGSAFGLALQLTPKGIVFAAVDDGQNVLDVWDSK